MTSKLKNHFLADFTLQTILTMKRMGIWYFARLIPTDYCEKYVENTKCCTPIDVKKLNLYAVIM